MDDFIASVFPNLQNQSTSQKGGEGSGNFNHPGRPGKVGGSAKKLPSSRTGTISELKRMMDNPDELVSFIHSLINEDFFGSIGLRGLYDDEKAETLRDSRFWDDGEPKEKLNGTSAIYIGESFYDPPYVWKENIKYNAKRVFSYGDGNVGLVIGDSGSSGEDIGEVVIPNAKMIYMWKNDISEKGGEGWFETGCCKKPV